MWTVFSAILRKEFLDLKVMLGLPVAGHPRIIEEEKVHLACSLFVRSTGRATVVGHYIVMDGPVFVFLCSRFFAAAVVVLVRGCNRLISFLLSYHVRALGRSGSGGL